MFKSINSANYLYGVWVLVLGSLMPLMLKNTSCHGALKPTVPSVILNLTEDGNVVALVKDESNYANTLFAVQLSARPTVKFPIVLENSSLSVGKNYAVFSSKKTGQKVAFELVGSTLNKDAGTKGMTTFSGFGYIRTTNEALHKRIASLGQGTWPPIWEFSCTCHEDNNVPKDCDSGGAGASECSTGSGIASVTTQCSVSCKAGYTACCKD